ncbi:hypothetical protein [Mycobacterium parmense]|uniref:Uncharacterized protein n=1 Tax=Mycobacterium parmense TaxID=185642 RepID=A0A7I7YYS0_9MYCO|nr:hypothetical protein [Mycobacterium parmense]MCV7350001.1 hypothetical protein [Mycobacterium parmense]BBZ46467.1 hypothetical protein MPRM_37480 [Mycobacterium parmense]
MTIHVEDTVDITTATRIRRIRSAFADARGAVDLKDAPQDLVAGFDEVEFDESVD